MTEWLPIALDPDVVGAGYALHSSVAQRLEKNMEHAALHHVYHTGARTWPAGTPGGHWYRFPQPPVGDPAPPAQIAHTKGVQVSTHPLQWMGVYQGVSHAAWPLVNPEEYTARLSMVVAVEQAPVHFFFGGVRSSGALGQYITNPGEVAEELSEQAGYMRMEPAGSTVVTMDIPFTRLYPVDSRRGELRGFLWILSEPDFGSIVEVDSPLLGPESFSEDGRRVRIAPNRELPRIPHHIWGLFELEIEGSELNPATRLGVSSYYHILTADGTGHLLLNPPVPERARQYMQAGDLYRAGNNGVYPVGYAVFESIHMEIVPNALIVDPEES